MALAFQDRWIWDFWIVDRESEHHMFYLQADRALGSPELRHWHVSIGHAVSADLREWTVLPDAIRPGPDGSWDDRSTWTGSVIRHNDEWLMFYTGTSAAEDGLVQRIGVARSADLIRWSKHDAPVLETDPERYETLSSDWHDQACRDPWVYADPTDGNLHMLFTARRNHGDPYDRGVVGHAYSPDGYEWHTTPPVARFAGFGQLEVPQVTQVGPHWYLLFCSQIETQAENRAAQGPGAGTYYAAGPTPTGPFVEAALQPLDVDRCGSTYAGRLHHTAAEGLVYLSWNRHGPDGSFGGTINDPRPVQVLDGSLRLCEPLP